MPALTPELAPLVVAGLGTLALAAWLLLLDPASPVNRAFSLLLFFRGSATLVSSGRQLWQNEAGHLWAGFFVNFPYFVLPAIPATIYFLSVYPRPRGLGRVWWGPWALLATTVGLLTWYFVDHSAYWTLNGYATGLAGTPGPLFYITTLTYPTLASAAYILARDYRLAPEGSRGYSTFLIASAFAINALVDGTAFAVPLIHTLATQGTIGAVFGDNYTIFSTVAALLAIPLGVGAIIQIAGTMSKERQDATLQEARRFIVYAMPATFIVAIIASIQALDGGDAATNFTTGFFRLLVPAMVTYALLRFSLFNADIRLKAGVRRAIIMVGFTVTFFILSEAAESLLGGRSRLLDILVAGLIALAAQPLRAGAERAADAIMPDTKPIREMNDHERRRMYHDQYLLVEHDGILTPKERLMLDRLAGALGFDEATQRTLETDAPDLGQDTAPMTSAHREVSVGRKFVTALLVAAGFGALSQGLEALVPASDFLVGLAAAAVISLLLGPIERLSEGRREEVPVDEASLATYRAAMDEALADGELSRRDRLYLGALAERLGIDPRTRRSLMRTALRRHDVRRVLPV